MRFARSCKGCIGIWGAARKMMCMFCGVCFVLRQFGSCAELLPRLAAMQAHRLSKLPCLVVHVLGASRSSFRTSQVPKTPRGCGDSQHLNQQPACSHATTQVQSVDILCSYTPSQCLYLEALPSFQPCGCPNLKAFSHEGAQI